MADLPGTVQPPEGTGETAELECPVCYQEYNQGTKCPRMLECLHVFCTECLQRIQLTLPYPPNANATPAISCPLCRHPTPLETGGPHSLPCQSRILSQLPPLAFRMPMSAHLATVTQRVVLSLEPQETRFIILPTVSLRVEQMGTERAEGRLGLSPGENQELQQRRRALVCVQLLSVVFWILFIMTCVVGVVFGPKFFHQ
ncbi:E3 ubiquitin-protein ligase RNF183 [Amia ocellicauda]|uniref:E3 ubiquitin-protein ligase RNF183 n=1 Tax=Amia ocellicauda TaxID=2972642 RepID=UPI003463F347